MATDTSLLLPQERQSAVKCSGWGTHVNPWLIHVNVWQKTLQYYKVISLQLININGKKKREREAVWLPSPGIQAGCRPCLVKRMWWMWSQVRRWLAASTQASWGTHFWTPSAMRIGKPHAFASKSPASSYTNCQTCSGLPWKWILQFLRSSPIRWCCVEQRHTITQETCPKRASSENKLNPWFNLPKAWMACYMAVYNLAQIFPIA